MKKTINETVLIFNFKDETKIEKLKEILKDLHINLIVATDDERSQTVGFLLGLRGFSARPENSEEEFDFPYEFMLFKDFTQNRYRQVIDAMKAADMSIPPCKAVLTPTNRFWSLKKICENMAKEHLSQFSQ